jgi:hypothetical protein
MIFVLLLHTLPLLLKIIKLLSLFAIELSSSTDIMIDCNYVYNNHGEVFR